MKDAKLERLSEVPVFSSCSKKELAEVGALADDVVVDAGMTIVEQGATVRHLYMLLKGSAEVTVDGEVVGTIEEGEVVGELAMFDPAPSSATVTMTEPGELLVIAHGRFDGLVRSNSDLAVSLLRTMARRMHSVQEAAGQ